MAPSITRWSQESVSVMRLPTRELPSTTTGFSTTAPTARMAPSGGLMMAENSSTSNMPRFEIEKVAPVISSGLSLPLARPLGEVLDLGGDLPQSGFTSRRAAPA